MRELTLITVIILFFSTNVLNALSQCPWNDYGQSWYLHFNDRSGPKETTRGRGAYVMFTNAASIPNSEVWKGTCPLISVLADWQTEPNTVHYSVGGFFRDSRNPYAITHYKGRGGILLYNPNEPRWDTVTNKVQIRPRLERFKFSIFDDEFTFNEAGEVYHRLYGYVGKFSCSNPKRSHPCYGWARFINN